MVEAVVGHPQAGPQVGPMAGLMAGVGHTRVEVDLIDIRVKVLSLESMILVFVVSNKYFVFRVSLFDLRK